MAKHFGRPTKLTPELTQKAYNYIYVSDQGEPFGICAGWTTDGSVIPTVEGFASYLQIHKDTAYEWAKIDENFSDVLREVKQQQASMLINGSLNNKMNPTIAKLLLSSKHGYIEKNQTENTGESKIIVETRHADNNNPTTPHISS